MPFFSTMNFISLTTGTLLFALLFVACAKEETTQPASPSPSIQTETSHKTGRRGGQGDGPVAIGGQIVNSGGGSLADVSIKLLEINTSNVLDYTLTDGKGDFLFEPVEQGDYQLEYTLSGYQDKMVTVFVSDTIYQCDTLH